MASKGNKHDETEQAAIHSGQESGDENVNRRGSNRLRDKQKNDYKELSGVKMTKKGKDQRLLQKVDENVSQNNDSAEDDEHGNSQSEHDTSTKSRGSTI